MEQLCRGLYEQESAVAKPTKAQEKPAHTVEMNTKKKTTLLVAAVLAIVAAAGWFLMGPGEEPAMSEETIETVPPSADELAYAEAEAGEHAKAGLTFGKLGDYKDARERSFEEWGYTLRRRTITYG